MATSLTDHFKSQLDQIIKLFDDIKSRAEHDDWSGGGVEEYEVQKCVTSARAVIQRIIGMSSEYGKQAQTIIDGDGYTNQKASELYGVLLSLKSDLESGYLNSLTEIIHGELFGDFLEMSEHLLTEGYKDAAAVIAGSSLEAHVRQLCIKNSIPVENHTPSGVKPKKADKMNSDLCGASIYEKLDQKNITAWLDLRNKAAHGLYSEYQKEQVWLMVSGIREFITRNPA
jgi:hypothetical protein